MKLEICLNDDAANVVFWLCVALVALAVVIGGNWYAIATHGC